MNAPRTEDATGHGLLVADLMSRDLLLLHDDTRVDAAVSLLIQHGYSGAPVINHRGRLTGMFHAVDAALMHLWSTADNTIDPSARHILVGDVSRAPVTIEPADSMREAALRMRQRNTDRLAVVKRPDRVIGVISSHDLLRTIARRGDLLLELVETQIAGMDLPFVHAAVDETGVVLLTGAVGSRAERLRLIRVITALDGVSGVDELLTVVPRQ